MKKSEKYYIRIYDKPAGGSNIPIKKADFIFYKKADKYHIFYVKYESDYIEYMMHGFLIIVNNGILFTNEEISKAFIESGYNDSDIIRIIAKLDKAEKEKKEKRKKKC